MKSGGTRLILFYSCVCSIISCSVSKNSTVNEPTANITSIRFMGQYNIPYAFTYSQTTVGGLSGIYDAKHGCYYLVCDDRSAINPARFYTAKIFITQNGIDSISFIAVNNSLQPNGNVYPNSKQDPYNTPDPEAIRYDPVQNQLTWSSEGERIVKVKDTVLENPSIRVITTSGKYKESFSLPSNFLMQPIEKEDSFSKTGK